MKISIHNTKDYPTPCPVCDLKITDDNGNSITNILSVTIHLDANHGNQLVINGAEITVPVAWDVHLDDIEAAIKIRRY